MSSSKCNSRSEPPLTGRKPSTPWYYDGDILGPASLLAYASLEGVREFLNFGGNAALAGDAPPIKIENVRGEDGDPPRALYCVLDGAMPCG